MADTNEEGRVMFGSKSGFTSTPRRVNNAVDKAQYSTFLHAASSIRKAARTSIEPKRKHGKPAPPGHPVRTKPGRGGWRSKRAILFSADKDEAVIGFAASRIDTAMQVHEHGGKRGNATYPPRPVMAPALGKNLARFHRQWRWALS